MALIVAVHGIGQQHRGPHQLAAQWRPALLDGLALAGERIAGVDLDCVFYGDLFRRPSITMAFGDPPYDAHDVTEPWETTLLQAWWHEAVAVDPAVVGPDQRVMVWTPRLTQRALNALSHSTFFAGLAERAVIFDLKQVWRYFHEPQIRTAIGERIAHAVSSDTRVLIGHSLGSVAAYEALCAHPEWPVRCFITLGSPLGIRNLIFDRLYPTPTPTPGQEACRGAWPGSVQRWTNIADERDLIALVKDLRPCFGERIENILVDNGPHAHNVVPYLTAKETGRAIAPCLTRGAG